MADEGGVPCLEQIKPAAVEDVIGGPALPINRYHLRAPTFSGEEDVKQLIAEFSEVAFICQWPARVALIQLRFCLTGSTKLYGIGQDFGDIFDALRAQFGLTAQDAQCNSNGLGEILRLP